MKKSIQIAFLTAGLAFSGWLLAEEKSIDDRLADLVAQGATVDQAAEALTQEHPEQALEILDRAWNLLSQLPYTACDDCRCGSGNVGREYPISELKKDDKPNWVDEVVNRYLQGNDQLMLPLYLTDEQLEQYYYHFKATAEMLEPYLQDSDEASEEDIQKAMKLLQERGFVEPVRLYLVASDQHAGIYKGRALIEAAKRLGIKEVPLRFAFTDCALCEGRSESAHYRVDEMREHSNLNWTAEQFFERMEFVLVDTEYPVGKYPFQYHYEASVEDLLKHFSGDPDEEQKKKWKKKLEKGMDAPLDIALQFWSKNVAFEEEAHAILAAAKDLGWKTIPVRTSFQDQVTCRSGMKRYAYSALELFPNDRIPIIAERFFEGKRRLILDEIGRHREVAAGYPFGKIFAYSAMIQVEELLKYIPKDQMPKQEDIDKRIEELNKNGVTDPIFVTLEQRNCGDSKDNVHEPEPITGPTTLPAGISHVIYFLANGETAKIDEYQGDIKDPTDPQSFIADIEKATGQTVLSYTIKAGTSHYDKNGNKVPDIPNQADHEYNYSSFASHGSTTPYKSATSADQGDSDCEDGKERLITIDKDSILTIVAVKQIMLTDRLPVRFLYIANRKRLKELCYDILLEACTKASGKPCKEPICEPGQDCTIKTPGGSSKGKEPTIQ